MFNVWLATLLLSPIVLTGTIGYFSWTRLAYPKLYIAIGVVVQWGAAVAVAVWILGNIGISGVPAPGPGSTGAFDPFTRHLCASLLIFLSVSVVFLFGLRRFMLKRVSMYESTEAGGR
jgi:hypothetical protein